MAFLPPSLLAALGTLWCGVGLGSVYALLVNLQFTYQANRARIEPARLFWPIVSGYALIRHLLPSPPTQDVGTGLALRSDDPAYGA